MTVRGRIDQPRAAFRTAIDAAAAKDLAGVVPRVTGSAVIVPIALRLKRGSRRGLDPALSTTRGSGAAAP